MHNHDLYFGLAAILVFAIVALAFGAYSAEKKMNDYTPPPPPPPIPPSRPVYSDPDDPDDPIGPAGPVRVLPRNEPSWWMNALFLLFGVAWGLLYLALQLLPYALMVLGLVVVVRWLV